MIQIKNPEHYKEVTAGELVLVDFYGITCAPCKIYVKELEKVAYDLPFVTIAKVCTDEQPELCEEFNINAVPTSYLYKNGEIVERFTGAKKAPDVEKLLAKHLYG